MIYIYMSMRIVIHCAFAMHVYTFILVNALSAEQPNRDLR